MIQLKNTKEHKEHEVINVLTEPEELDKRFLTDYISGIDVSKNKTLLMLQISIKIRDLFANKDNMAGDILPIIVKSNNAVEYDFIKDGDIAIIANSAIMTGQHVSLRSKLNPYSIDSYRRYMGLDNSFRAALTGRLGSFEVKRSGTISDDDLLIAKEALVSKNAYDLIDTVKLTERSVIAIEFKIVDSYTIVGVEKRV